MNKEFTSLCQWFIDNKLSIHFGEDKTRETNTSFADHPIKQHETVEYFGWQLESKLSGGTMAPKVLKKINAKLKFLYR